MSGHIGLSEALTHYVQHHTRESAVAQRLRVESELHPRSGMLTTADQAQFLGFLVRLTGARCVIEVGTFTGYSALVMAEALPQDGSLIACDISEEFTAIGKRYWAEAGVAERIDLRIAPAISTLTALAANQPANIDMMFIDADKNAYDAYYELALQLVRQGGLIVFDNMLWGGAVADVLDVDKQTVSLRTLNAKIHADERVEASLLTVADGMMLVQKR